MKLWNYLTKEKKKRKCIQLINGLKIPYLPYTTMKENSEGSNEPRIKANIGLSNENKKCQKLSVTPES